MSIQITKWGPNDNQSLQWVLIDDNRKINKFYCSEASDNTFNANRQRRPARGNGSMVNSFDVCSEVVYSPLPGMVVFRIYKIFGTAKILLNSKQQQAVKDELSIFPYQFYKKVPICKKLIQYIFIKC